ncbi:MAG: T9SS type A sorting domain-containing protein [Saprospiraceae bacterium]|nr:T9SS type A sorting domain-containing protein [Saprospiraceae bacterium]MCF8252585.1 T9SS type A sorting domain-containing protein [Saprospiraceae bacterium]MCF8282626.1 T9SS type A sorting domain-containing protein [Bacteroidales bacterium]MCF8314171.1 T9SS type A sorting domain-containing protein [Saprospiraceae bacterium]MCF8442937.1 T9SS type A sorting domain-containing protein [Saprospiraceae bacterium]
MKRILLSLALLSTISLSAQDLVQVSYGASYKNQTYYQLSDDVTASLDNNTWDIAFTTYGENVGGIHLNESTVTFGAEAVLYLAPTANFDDPIIVADLTERLYNDEKSWDYGAFNSTRDVNDPNDFGWGMLDAGTGKITGNTVFVLRFKDGTYQKLQIVSLEQGIYTIKHADLDGSNENTLTVDKANFTAADFAYLALSSGQTLPSIPIDWDLVFLRYASPNDDGAGGIIQIMSSGVLSAPGVEVAQANFVDPDDVEFADFEDSLSTDIDIIGSDWKTFNNTSWLLVNDRAYFVKAENGAVWKLIFVDFGGSTTGNVIFSKELILETGVGEEATFDGLSVYPNPTSGDATLFFSPKNTGVASIGLTNLFGQLVWSGKLVVNTGFNAVQLPLNNLPSGQYFAKTRLGSTVFTKKIVKN